MNLVDHAGVRLAHGKPRVNAVEIHYAVGGAGEPVFLLHGVPKTMLCWRRVVPLLTPHYTVVVVDNRGAGGSERPLTGYDTATMAGDVAELLLAGRERPFWTWYARRQMWDPSALAEEDIDEIVRSAEQPGGNRAIFEMYRARQTDAEQNRPHYADPISCPVLAVGAQAYLDFFAGD
jgi:alpha/beta hydrolase fold